MAGGTASDHDANQKSDATITEVRSTWHSNRRMAMGRHNDRRYSSTAEEVTNTLVFSPSYFDDDATAPPVFFLRSDIINDRCVNFFFDGVEATIQVLPEIIKVDLLKL